MDSKLRALVVDDEQSSRRLLHTLLQETTFFKEIIMANSVDSALRELMQFDPDLIFLDINMPDKDGFTFLKDFPREMNKPAIVFVTAFDQYAIKAIKNGAFDYLLKPVNRKELKECIIKYSETIKVSNNTIQEKTEEHYDKIQRIRINSRNGTLFINPATILYCKAEGNYTTVCTGEKKYLCSMNIGKIKELLSGSGFIRLGRSYIINFEYITLLDRKEGEITLVRDKESVKIRIPKQHLKHLDTI
jgi:two-component system, LytTR family, response regulator